MTRQGLRGRVSSGDVVSGLAVLLLAPVLAFGVAAESAPVMALCALPLVPLALANPNAMAVLTIWLLPWTKTVLPGPLQIAASDVTLALALAGYALNVAANDHVPYSLRRAKGVLAPVVVYFAVMSLVVALHFGQRPLVSLAQRLEVVLLPVLLGAALLTKRHLDLALRGFVISAIVLSLAFIASGSDNPVVLGVQKNPAGQFIAAALLILAATARHQRSLVVLGVPVLILGLLFTGSRGAIVGLLAGAVVFLLVQPGASRIRAAMVAVPLVVLAVGGFTLLPQAAQERFGDVESRRESAAGYTVFIREAYRDDAKAVIRDHPVTGVGPGQYLAGSYADGTLTNDPHQVLLLEAAEGGLPLAAGFLVLFGGALTYCWLRRADNRFAPLAAAVTTSALVHGLLDVYWVRGTPLIGWLLVGAVARAASSVTPASDMTPSRV